jgi:hypothetical protein
VAARDHSAIGYGQSRTAQQKKLVGTASCRIARHRWHAIWTRAFPKTIDNARCLSWERPHARTHRFISNHGSFGISAAASPAVRTAAIEQPSGCRCSVVHILPYRRALKRGGLQLERQHANALTEPKACPSSGRWECACPVVLVDSCCVTIYDDEPSKIFRLNK